jgi:peptidyl-prolyl cis-trans isomerase D
MIQDAVQVTEAELRERYRVEQERVNFHFVRLSAGDFAAQVQVTAEEVKNFYERNREALKEPLKVQVEYLTYRFDGFASRVQVGEKEVEEYYRAQRDVKFRQPKAVRLRHILLRLPAGADPKQKQEARAKAEAALEEVRAGKNFAELAKRFSEEPSAAQGGEAGWFAQGQLLPPVERAAFALKKGEASGIVESAVGYHILKVEDVREERTKELKEAREEIVRALRTERGRGEAAKAADADREKALSGSELSALAKERGLAHKVTSLFSGPDAPPELARIEDFSKAAFSLSLKEVGPIIEGADAYYLFKVKERREPSVPPFESARPDIEKRLKETKAMELAMQKANALLEQLKKGRDIKRLAADNGLKIEETGWFARSDPEIPKVGALQELRPGGLAFSLYQPIADRVYTQKRSLYLFAFKESQAADMERFEKGKSEFQQQALGVKRRMALQRFVDGLKAKAKITVNPRVLEQS